MNDAMQEFLGTKLCGSLSETWKRMEIAEQEIRLAMERHPGKAPYIDRVGFGLLVPPQVLDGLSDEVYRRHAREILGRLEPPTDTREATQAELLGVLSAASFIAPLGATAAALYARAFAKIFPERADLVDGLGAGVHVDDWLVEEMERDLRRKLAKKNSMRRPS